jgi:hypothetical protein
LFAGVIVNGWFGGHGIAGHVACVCATESLHETSPFILLLLEELVTLTLQCLFGSFGCLALFHFFFVGLLRFFLLLLELFRVEGWSLGPKGAGLLFSRLVPINLDETVIENDLWAGPRGLSLGVGLVFDQSQFFVWLQRHLDNGTELREELTHGLLVEFFFRNLLDHDSRHRLVLVRSCGREIGPAASSSAELAAPTATASVASRIATTSCVHTSSLGVVFWYC